MKLSMIIPIYKEAKDLDRFLKIIYSQTSHNYEVVVIVDTNKDKVLDVLGHHKNKFHKKLRLIYNSSRIGRTAAIKIGIKHARGLYSIVLSSSNVIKKNFVEQAIKVIDKSNADIIEFRATFKEPIKFSGEIRLKIPKPVEIRKNLKVVAYAYAFDFNKLFKTTTLKETLNFNEKIVSNSRYSIGNTYKAFVVAKTYSNTNTTLVVSKSKISLNFNPMRIIKQWQLLIKMVNETPSYRLFTQEVEYAAFANIVVFLFGIAGTSKNQVLLNKLEKVLQNLSKEEFSSFLESNQYMAKSNFESSLFHVEFKRRVLVKLYKEFK